MSFEDEFFISLVVADENSQKQVNSKSKKNQVTPTGAGCMTFIMAIIIASFLLGLLLFAF